MLVATTTATRPPEDEWDKPSEIPQLALNRVGATSQILQSLSDMETRFKKSLFGQLKRFCNTWESRHWRRSYQHVTDKGQSRAFFAKFLEKMLMIMEARIEPYLLPLFVMSRLKLLIYLIAMAALNTPLWRVTLNFLAS